MLPRWIASTVGPTEPMRVSSNKTTNTAGARSIAHRDRITRPAVPPTTRLATIDASAANVVNGPRGINQPAIAPYVPASNDVTPTPMRQSPRPGTSVS